MVTIISDRSERLIQLFWDEYLGSSGHNNSEILPHAFYFCDNEEDANECSELVLKGIKQATATSLWWYMKHGAAMPTAGTKYIITNWDSIPTAIVEVTKVEMIPFNKVTKEFAAIEGEGDKSLNYWREVHEAYYNREMTPYGDQFDEKMIIVCEYFKKTYS